jgi:predicted dehydrogenase
MAERPLRLGIVGANPTMGWAPRTHLPAIVGLPEIELTAVCTTKEESARESAEKFDARKAYSNYKDLVADPDVEIVDVCVRVPYHYDIVMAALEAGKNVYCEWPLAATVKQAEDIVNLAEKKGVRTMVGLQSRGSPSLLHLHKLIADGWIGKVVSVNMTHLGSGLLSVRGPDATWRGDKTNGANTMTIAGGHSIDAVQWVVEPFTEVAALVDTLAPEWPMQDGGVFKATAPDHVAFTARLANGGIANVQVASLPHHASGFRMEVYGSEGTLVATGGQAQTMGVDLKGGQAGDKELKNIDVPANLRRVPSSVPDGTPVNFGQMLSRFAEGIRENKPTTPTFADALRNHRLLDAIERSSQSHAAVKVS